MTTIVLDDRTFELITEPRVFPPGVDGLYAIFAVQNTPDQWASSGPGEWRLITVLVASDIPRFASMGLMGESAAMLFEGYRRDGEYMALGVCPMPGAGFIEVGSAASDLLFNRTYRAAMVDWSRLDG